MRERLKERLGENEKQRGTVREGGWGGMEGGKERERLRGERES